MRAERVIEVIFGGIEGKVSDIQFITHYDLLLSDKPVFFTDCSRTPGLKSSLNSVHLKIHHALKETSYPTDGISIAGSEGKATTIGNILLGDERRAAADAKRSRVDSFTMTAAASMMVFPAEKLNCRR